MDNPITPENPDQPQAPENPAVVPAKPKSKLSLFFIKMMPAKSYRKKIISATLVIALAVTLPVVVSTILKTRTSFFNRASNILTGEPTPTPTATPTPTPTSTPTPTPPPGCKISMFSAYIKPLDQSGKGGTALKYIVYIKNNNGNKCPPAYFDGSAYTKNGPGWQVSPPNFRVMIPSGQTGTVAVWFTSPTSATPGKYNVNVDVSQGTSSRQVKLTATYTVIIAIPTATPIPVQ